MWKHFNQSASFAILPVILFFDYFFRISQYNILRTGKINLPVGLHKNKLILNYPSFVGWYRFFLIVRLILILIFCETNFMNFITCHILL